MTNMTDITGMYSDAYANAANQSASKLKDKLNGTDYSKATDDELLDACKQFEAYFVEQLYKGMMKTVPQSEETSNYTSTMTDFYKDQMLQSIAEQTTEQSGLGLAQMLYEQMKRNYGLDTVSAEAMEAAAAANASETAEA
ncbi:MAG: rod-binding protein [Butyrivibrio sp.]|nr:rod-binding protein [Acetatifactor muris]MCM1559207.1 rod-binding protein [Butyrivibrio sp.]